jgi:hypothetical protein
MLVLSVALWAPTARLALAGNVDLVPALVRYLAALAVAWAAVAAVTRVTDGYRSAIARDAMVSATESSDEADDMGPGGAPVLDTTAVLEAVSDLGLAPETPAS